MPVPDSYVPRSRMNRKLIGAGGAVLGTFWLVSTLAAVLGSTFEEEDPGNVDGVDPEDWAWLYIPVAGPFIALATVQPSVGGAGLLVMDGLGQTAGLGLLIAGLLDVDHHLVLVDYGGLDLEVHPLAGGITGLGATGSF